MESAIKDKKMLIPFGGHLHEREKAIEVTYSHAHAHSTKLLNTGLKHEFEDEERGGLQ